MSPRVALLCLVLAACSAPPAEDSPRAVIDESAPRADFPPQNVRVSDSKSLISTWYEWAPAGDLRRGDIVFRIDGERMVANSDCATWAWTYGFVGGRLRIERAPVSSCVRGVTAREERFARALDSANQAYRRGRDLLFEGPGGTILLFNSPGEGRPPA